ncbi:MAG TPA: SDR family NAD(P)-dependent oxidoreductase, partial [Reyranella sp.]|nr:SDR family NAD(P)-dependent oxidoreductase [Reyranella sp.]
MSLEDALAVVALRGEIFERMEPGGMLSVQMPEARLRARLAPELDLAAVNDRELCVVSGPTVALGKLEAGLKADGIESRRVRINVAAHSRLLDPHLDAFRSGVRAIGLSPPRLRFVSTLTAEPEADLLASSDYWIRHLRHTVRFADALDAVLKGPDTILVEVGPGQALSALARLAQGGKRPVAVLASCRQADEPDGDVAFALSAAGRLWVSGQELDWDRIRPEGGGRKISLPTYAFERERHWIEPGLKPATAETAVAPREISRLSRLDDWFLVPEWRPIPMPPAAADPTRHCLVFGGHTRLGHALEKGLAGRTVHVIRRGESFGRSADGSWCMDPANSDHYARLLSDLERDGVRPDGIFYLWALDAEGTEQAQLFEPIFRLCQALQRHDAGTAVQLLAATSGTLAPQGERVAHPERATLLGPCHAATREIPLLQAQLVDLEDPVGAAEAAAAQLVSEFDGRARDGLVAYRGNVRWVQEIVAAPQADSAEFPARLVRKGVYVITGGLGGVGLELAQFLAGEVHAHLALIGRREPDAEALQRLRQIEQAGAEVLVVQADIADREQTQRALQSVVQRFGPINGVFHAAGLLDDAPLAMKTLEDARRVMSAKVAGGAVLDALLPPGTIDLFAVFSSTSAIVGVPGQVDYIAANAYLDALAASRPDGLAIDWGVWRDVGMAAKRYRTPDPALAVRAALHPLLGAETARSETEMCFEAVMEAGDTWPIGEHLVAGRPVLPGMAYIEIARAAMSTVRPGPVEIANLSLVAPLAFGTGESRRVRTALTVTSDGFDFTVRSQSLIDRDEWTAHAHARIRAAAPAAAQLATLEIPPADGLGLAIQRPEPAQADTVSFGPRWRNLSAQRLAATGGVAEIELADRFADDLSTYSFHPAMADMAATFGLALVKAAAGPGMVFLPMSVERVRLFAPLPRRFKSFCRLTRQVENSFVTFDVLCTAFDGEPIAALEGFTLRCAPAAAVAAPSPSAGESRPAVQQILANGIRAAEAPSLFRRVLGSPHRRIVVSSIALTDLRRVLAEESRAAAPQKRSEPAQQAEGARYASDIEARVASYWSELLGVERVAANDEFFALGGHSLAAVRLFARIRKQLGVDLPLASLYEARSLRQFSELVASKLERPAPADIAAEDGGSLGKARLDDWSPLVTVNRGSPSATPFFCVHGGGGNVLTFSHLAGALGADQPFYGLQAVGVDGLRRPLSTIEQMASGYLEAVRAVRPNG